MMSRITADYGVNDAYKRYAREHNTKVTRKQYSNICSQLNEEAIRLIIYENTDFKLPLGLGSLRILKYKPKLKLDEKGRLITNRICVDYPKTKEAWERDPKKKAKKTVIFNFNEHTKGYQHRFWWDKRTSHVKNQSAYYIRLSRKNKRLLAKALKDDSLNIDYYQ